MRPGKLSALSLGDQRRLEAIGTDTIYCAQANIWVGNVCMCWKEVYL